MELLAIYFESIVYWGGRDYGIEGRTCRVQGEYSAAEL